MLVPSVNVIDAIEAIGRQALGVEVDIRDANAVARSFEIVEAELGPVDILVNNAAGNFEVPAERMSANAFRTVVDIVLNGTFHCTRAAGKHWIDAKSPGAVLNIATTYAWTGSAFVLPSALQVVVVSGTTASTPWSE